MYNKLANDGRLLLGASGLEMSPGGLLNLNEPSRRDNAASNLNHTIDSDTSRPHLWTTGGLYHHLKSLSVPPGNLPSEASLHRFIQAFLFRVNEAITVVAPDKNLVFDIQHSISSVTSPADGGNPLYVDYAVFLRSGAPADEPAASIIPTASEDKEARVFCITHTNHDVLLTDVKPAIYSMYACARQYRQNVVRGVLTNGLNWLFLVLKIDDLDSTNVSIFHSFPPGVPLVHEETTISKPASDLIAAILTEWILHSADEIVDDDYFTVKYPQ